MVGGADKLNQTAHLAEQFEEERPRLTAMAYRMLGSAADADDVAQEAWLRLQNVGTAEIDTLGAWLTTVVSRLCIDRLRGAARRSKLGDAFVGKRDPVEEAVDRNPEEALLLSDAVGVALLVVLERLRPAERVAFVLHDLFAVDFNAVARVLECSPAAARQMASRARRAVRGCNVEAGGADRARKQALVDAFFAASRAGDLDALIAILDPDVVLTVEAGVAGTAEPHIARGLALVAQRASSGASHHQNASVELVNGEPAIVVSTKNHKLMTMRFDIRKNLINRIVITTK